MNRRRYAMGMGLGLATAMLAGTALPAMAQDDGEFVILSARYGTDRNNVDVTDRLRDIAGRDRRVRLTNDLFGVDPDPNRDKMLRIYARDRAGRERRFEYPERAWVDGMQFIGWGGGRWGDRAWNGGWAGNPHRDPVDDGQYTIISASYGNPGREADVTERLRALSRRDRSFRMGNDTFGVDPDPGRAKRLLIVTRDSRGQTKTFEYSEGSTVDGGQFIGWGV